jgi:glyoxylase-like metal-dependent hydrolase (beta-lactamase superfamily II)
MDDGERQEIGEVLFAVLHTPGHTPEHISLLVTDRSRRDEPTLLLSGGALLVGDVARPDLLGGRVPEFDRLRSEGAMVLDCRAPEAFTAHIPGALNIAKTEARSFERRA